MDVFVFWTQFDAKVLEDQYDVGGAFNKNKTSKLHNSEILKFKKQNKRSKLRILTWKKHPKIKLLRLQKIRIWTLGSFVHQINSFYELLKLKQLFKKNKVVTGKSPLFVIGPFCSRHSICLNICFWQSSFEWKWCVFNLSGFN